MHMPKLTLIRYLRMLAQEILRVSWSPWINLLERKEDELLFRFVLHPHALVEERQVVMGCQIVWINSLQSLELFHSLVWHILLIIGNTEFAPCISRLRKLFDHLFQVRYLGIVMSIAALNLCMIVSRARVAWAELQCSVNSRPGRSEFLPTDIRQADIGIAVRIVGSQLYYLAKGMHRVDILLLVQVGDAQIIPAHPVRIITSRG